MEKFREKMTHHQKGKKKKINSLPTEDKDVGNYYSHARHSQGKTDRMGRQRNVSYFGKEENAL